MVSARVPKPFEGGGGSHNELVGFLPRFFYSKQGGVGGFLGSSVFARSLS